MKILLIGNFPGDRQESMQRFADLLHSGLTARGHSVTTLVPTAKIARLAGAYRYGGLPKYLGYLDKFFLFPLQLRRYLSTQPTDVVHIVDHSNAVYARATRKVPTLATCHDLLQIRAALGEFPEQRLGRFGRLYQAWILRHIARLPHAACDSTKTRADVLRLSGLPPARVTYLPISLNYPYGPLSAETARPLVDSLLVKKGIDPVRLNSARGGFFLNVGGGHWYKNRPGLLAIYAELRRLLQPCPLLALVGPPLSSADAALAAKLGVAGDLVLLSDVPNATLQALYSLAEGLIFPSWEEGFGWPIAEAQACGCPVFTSNRAPMTEVGGNSSVYFDPTDPVTAARLIASAWSGREQRRAAGLVEAARWAPEIMFAAYEKLYAGLVGARA
jgi:glycosyltransferase involved in cell wall biosynthesis